MKNCELKEYLNTFPDDTEVSVILADPRERKLYQCVNVFGIIDTQNPTFCIDVGQASDMDAEMIAVSEECEHEAEIIKEQINVFGFPEVMP